MFLNIDNNVYLEFTYRPQTLEFTNHYYNLSVKKVTIYLKLMFFWYAFSSSSAPNEEVCFFRLTGIHKKTWSWVWCSFHAVKAFALPTCLETEQRSQPHADVRNMMVSPDGGAWRRNGGRCRAVRRMHSIMLTARWMLTARSGEVFTPHRALPCLGRDRSVKLRSSTASVPKRSENAFYMYVPPMQWRAGRPHLQDRYCKFTIYFLNSSLFMKKIKKNFISPEKRKQER